MRTLEVNFETAVKDFGQHLVWLIQFDLGTGTYRFCDADIDLYHQGEKWLSREFDINTVQYQLNMSVDQTKISLDNIDRTFSAIIEGEEIRGRAATVSQAVVIPDIKAGLVFNARFEEGSGNVIHDYSSYAITGSYCGQANWVTGKLGGAITFAGSGQYAIFPNCDHLRCSSNQTVCFWYKRPTAIYSSWNPWGTHYTAEGAITVGQNGGLVYYYGISSGSATNSYISRGSSLLAAVGQWGHWVVTRDFGNNLVTWYHNGLVCSTGTAPGSATLSNADFRLGKGYMQANQPYSRGSIDEVRMYDRALASEEIMLIYNSQESGISQGPIYIYSEPIFIGVIDSAEYDHEKASFNIYNRLIYWRRRIPRRTYSPACMVTQFKGPDCKYTGINTFCDRSYARCSSLGNTNNFRGFRFMPDLETKELWWGRTKG